MFNEQTRNAFLQSSQSAITFSVIPPAHNYGAKNNKTNQMAASWIWAQLGNLIHFYVYIVLPWFLPKKLYDFVIVFFGAGGEGADEEGALLLTLFRIPVLGAVISFTYQNYRTICVCV